MKSPDEQEACVLRRWRGPLMLGAAAITACFAVELVAIVVGTAAAGTVAAVLDPVAGVLVASAVGLIVYGIIRRYRRKRTQYTGTRCAPTEDR